MHKRKLSISTILTIPTTVIAVFFLFNKTIYRFLLDRLTVKKIPASSIDAVMALAFEPERIKKAHEWIEKYPNSHWLISLGYNPIPLVQQQILQDLKTVLSRYDLPDKNSKIIKDSSCTNTYDEAKLLSETAIKNGWKKILIVSAPYHMRRVKFIFEKLRPESMAYYYDHWEWNEYNKESHIYRYDSYNRLHWKNPLEMIPPVYCWNFMLIEWIKNIYYWIKY